MSLYTSIYCVHIFLMWHCLLLLTVACISQSIISRVEGFLKSLLMSGSVMMIAKEMLDFKFRRDSID